MRNVDEIIIHCSDTPEDREVSVEEIRKWHTLPKPKGNGWKDIGYHFVVLLDGTIAIGRPLDEVGAHTLGHNRDTIGVCYVGGREKTTKKPKDTLNADQEQAIIDLVTALRIVFAKILKISGHNDYANKACPSFIVAQRFPQLIETDNFDDFIM